MNGLNIICCTDYSTFSLNAAIYALRFAAATESSLRFFHAYDLAMGSIPSDTGEFSKMRMIYKNVELEKLERFQDAVLQEMVDERLPKLTDPIVAEGNPGSALREELKGKQRSLVITATHSYGSRPHLLGTNAWDIAKKSETPVLLIPPGRRFARIKQIVVSAEAEDQEVSFLNSFVKMAELFKSAITILHVGRPGVAEKKETENFDSFKNKILSKNNYGKLNVQLTKSMNIEEGLNHYCVSSNTDWLIMVHHEKGWFRRILGTEAHSKKMSSDSEVPLLVIPESCFKNGGTSWQLDAGKA